MSPDDEQLRRERMTKFVIALGLAAVLVIAILVVVSQSGGSDDATEGGAAELAGLEQQGLVLGDPAAPVTVIEFADLQCPICRAFARQQVPTLIADEVRPGRAKLEFRPWTIIGPDSKIAHEAALAAARQDKLWNFVLAFYDQQQAENSGYVSAEFLGGVAADAGLDIPSWEQDRSDPALAQELKKNEAAAIADGFTGTPSILVQGPGGRVPFKGNTVPTAAEIASAIARVSQPR